VRFDAGSLRQLLWIVAHAATELLRSERLDRLSRCRRCRWLYLDASKARVAGGAERSAGCDAISGQIQREAEIASTRSPTFSSSMLIAMSA
jgi:predicted RNA-binding Zn ribbon-like protein